MVKRKKTTGQESISPPPTIDPPPIGAWQRAWDFLVKASFLGILWKVVVAALEDQAMKHIDLLTIFCWVILIISIAKGEIPFLSFEKPKSLKFFITVFICSLLTASVPVAMLYGNFKKTKEGYLVERRSWHKDKISLETELASIKKIPPRVVVTKVIEEKPVPYPVYPSGTTQITEKIDPFKMWFKEDELEIIFHANINRLCVKALIQAKNNTDETKLFRLYGGISNEALDVKGWKFDSYQIDAFGKDISIGKSGDIQIEAKHPRLFNLVAYIDTGNQSSPEFIKELKLSKEKTFLKCNLISDTGDEVECEKAFPYRERLISEFKKQHPDLSAKWNEK
jgi:hypothetical protein